MLQRTRQALRAGECSPSAQCYNLLSMPLAALQLLDPTPFAAFGVLGGLLFAVAIMCGLVWRLFSKQSEMFEAAQATAQHQSKILMDWVDAHRRETHTTMQGVADTVSRSHDDLAAALTSSLGELKHVINRQSQRLNEAFITSAAYSALSGLPGRRRGDPLDETLVAKIEQTVRAALQDQQRRDG